MKKVSLILICSFLSVFILASGSELSLYKMVCLGSGKATFSIIEQEDCCKETSSKNTYDASLSSKCCDFSSWNYHLQTSLTTQNNSLFSVVPCLQFLPKTVDYFSLSLDKGVTFLFSFFNDSSPPPSGKKLLNSICQYLI